MNEQQPLFTTTRFNDQAFNFSNWLTLEKAERYFISNVFMPMPGIAQASKLLLLNAGSSISGINSFGCTTITLGGTLITATANEINYLAGASHVAVASKALILDGSRSATNLNQLTMTTLTATNISGTLQTADQSNITKIGTQLDLRVNGFIRQSNNVTSDTLLSIRSNSTFKLIHTLDAEMNMRTTTNHGLTLGTNDTTRITISNAGVTTFNNDLDATNSSTGSVVMTGGLAIAKRLFVGTDITTPTINVTTSLAAPVMRGRLIVNQATDGGSITESGTNSIQINSQSNGTLTTATLYMGASSTDNNAWLQSSKTGAFCSISLQPRGGNLVVGSSGSFTEKLYVNGTTRITSDAQINGQLSVIRTASNPTYISTVGTSTFRMYHMKDSTVFIETFTNHQLTLGTNSTPRLEINTAGNINITSDVESAGPILGGVWTGAFSCYGGGTFAKNLFVGTDLGVLNNGSIGNDLSVTRDVIVTRDVSAARLTLNSENNSIRINRPSNANQWTRLSANGGINGGSFDIFAQGSATNWSGLCQIGLRGTGQNEGGRMTLLSTLRGTSTLDLGVQYRPNILIINQPGGQSASQIGCNENTMTFTSSRSQGFSWHSNTAITPANWEDLGVETMTLNTAGELRTASNMFARAGMHCNGFSTTATLQSFGDSGHMHYANNRFSIFAYNYNVLQVQPWRNISLGNNRLFIADGDLNSTGHIGIGTETPAFPLDVQRTTAGSFTGGYGYLSPTATGFGGSTGTVQVSIRASGRIVCPEFNASSDRRLKTNIKPVTLETAMSFVKEVEPVQYNLRGSDGGASDAIDIGYIAQNLLESSDPTINDVVSWFPNESMVDEGGTHEPVGYSAAVNYNEIIPILHKALANALDRIELLESRLRTRDSNGRFTKRISG